MWLLALGTACVAGDTEPTTAETPAPPPANTWTVYRDADDDGYGVPEGSRDVAADAPGWVRNKSDCDDSDPTVNPSGTDRCQNYRAVDGDCDGWAHPDDDSEVCRKPDGCPLFADVDGDGIGGALIVTYEEGECWWPDQVPFLVDRPGDCDDFEPLVNPDVPEVCDAIDNNCDDVIDEGC